MKKLLFISLFLVANVNSDVDLGEDFAAGDLVTADAFNTKFNALNGVVGEIVDADLLGNWECTAYKDIADGIDEDFQIANGGNGQVGNGFFASNTGTLNLTELDTESSLTSPKSWSITRSDVIHRSSTTSGLYSLLANKIWFYHTQKILVAVFYINMLSSTKISLITDGQMYGSFPNENIICEIITESESESE